MRSSLPPRVTRMTTRSDYAAVPLLAHRGYAAHYPENTLEALRAAVAAGARFVEFDIQLCRDGIPLLLHDANFRRTGDRDLAVFAVDAAEAITIPVGERRRFGDRFAEVMAPTLAATMTELRSWPEVAAFAEMKGESIAEFGLGAALDRVLPVLQPALDQCVVISFDADFVRAARDRTGCRIGWAIRSYDEASLGLARELAPDYLFCNHEKMPAKLWAGDWVWVAYEVTNGALARDLIDRGCGMLETMLLPELRAELERAPA